MATSNYINGRSPYTRPQAIIWTKELPLIDSTTGNLTVDGVEGADFLILSDHNRSELSFSQQRIENRKRMINGSLRSYHIANKTTMSWSWDMLPSRPFNKDPQFNLSTGLPTATGLEKYIVDGGAGGVDLIDWYTENTGSFYSILSYDRYDKFASAGQYLHLSQYSDILEVNFASFDYSVIKRGGTTHDFWNISVSLEEV
jgi:hypothetical protein